MGPFVRSDVKLCVRLLGPLQLSSPSGRKIDLVSRKAQASLGILLLSRAAQETRGKLATMLWSDSDEEHARSSLRQVLTDLKQLNEAVGTEVIVADKTSISINRNLVAVDIDVLEQDPIPVATRPFADLCEADDCNLLSGLEDCDMLFGDWLHMCRSNWTDKTVRRLVQCMQSRAKAGEATDALPLFLLKLDPYCELAVQEHLSRLAASSGAESARSYFNAYKARLWKEFEVEPSESLCQFADELRDRQPRKSGATTRPMPADHGSMQTGRDRPSIVLATISPDKGDSGFDFTAIALSSDFAASLSRFRHWTVVQSQLDAHKPLAEHAKEFAAAKMDCAVFIHPDDSEPSRFVNVTCVDCETAETIKCWQLETPPSGWREVFNDLSAGLAAHLQTYLATSRLHRLDENTTNFRSAYDLWLEGQSLGQTWRVDTERRAFELYEQAVEIDPDFACAYSGMASILNSRWTVLPGLPTDESERGKALEFARKALQLDPLDHRNHVNLAWTHLLSRRWEVAEAHFKMAYDLNPNNPYTLIAFALASAMMGERQRAVDLCNRAFELNPLREGHFHGYRATLMHLAARHQDCIESVEACPDIFPDIQGWAAASHAVLGHRTEAAQCYGRFIADVAGVWAGSEPASEPAIRHWLLASVPIRLEPDIAALTAGLKAASRWWQGAGPT